MTRTIKVDLGLRSYNVRIAPGMLARLGPTVAHLGEVSSAVVVSDSNVSELYGLTAIDSLKQAGVSARQITFPAGEQHKTLASASNLLDELLWGDPPADRRSVVVALGGGVTGDLAGFVAAVALRGLRWVQCPTSLLADVDASVGGKTAVDHPSGKNLIGVFHQPAGVLIDIDTLKTLPREEFINGLAECVKHAVIRDAELLNFIEDNTEKILALDPGVLTDFIARNVEIKAAVVSADERESGMRVHLNYGHTVAHAIETFVGYDRITHGQAVALGMAAAGRMAARRGLIEDEVAMRVEKILADLRLPVRMTDVGGGIGKLNPRRIREIMQRDKKTRGGRIRMILPVAPGQVSIFDDITPDAIDDAVEYINR